MNGVIVLDKPAGFTSFDAVALARGLTKEKKTGHTGTLDPMATGVLPLLLGRAAKASSLLPDTEKEYAAGFRLGQRFDTGDVTGTLVEESGSPVSQAALERGLEGFRGEIRQTPPMYSAVSVGGQRLYQLARKGIEVDRPSRTVTIFSLTLERYDEASREGVLRAACSQGTYIRTLIEDIAQSLGTCGVMTSLRRTRACGFSLEDAVSLDQLRELAAEGSLDAVLRPVEELFGAYPPVSVSGPQAARFCNGGALDMRRLRLPRIALPEGQRLRLYGPGGAFLGLARVDLAEGQLKFLKRFTEDPPKEGAR